MHKLLARQLRKAAEGSLDGTVDVARLIAMVDLAYEEADRERRLKDRALDVMQTEVEEMSRRVAQEAEARFKLLMDNVGEAVVVFDVRGTIEGYNREAEKIFGYTADEVWGRNVSFLIPDESALLSSSLMAPPCGPNDVHVLGMGARDLLGERKDGTEFAAEIAIGEVSTGGHRQYIAVIRDISLRRQAEQELRESESRFRDLAGSASDWFWETDEQYRLTFVSERIGNVLGVKPAAVIGNTWFEIGLDDQPDLAAAHRAVLDAKASFRDMVFTVGPPDGNDARVIRLSAIPTFAADGSFSGYRGVGADITREARAVRQAIRAQEQLRDAIDSITDAIAVYDSKGKMVIWNQAYAETLRNAADYLAPGIAFEDVLRHGHRNKLFDIGTQDFEDWLVSRLKRFRHPDGVAFILKLSGGRWVQSRECPTREGGVVAVRTDISQLKRREEDLDQLRRRYELILDSAGEGIVGLDRSGRVTFANRVAGEIIGRTSGDMIGQCFNCLINPDSARCDGTTCLPSASAVVEAYLSGTPGQVSGEVIRHSDQQAIPVDYFVAPIIGDGQSSGTVLVYRDATLRLQSERSKEEQKHELEFLVAERTGELQRQINIRALTETALRASRERLKGITDSLFEGVLVVDRSGYISFANPSAKQLLDYHEDDRDIEGHPLESLMKVGTPAGAVTFAGSPFQRSITEDLAIHDDDAVFISASGKSVAVAYACSPHGEDADKRSVIISFRNIEALKRAQREALQASRLASVGQLAAGIAHEINTPIQYVGDNLRFISDSLIKLMSALTAARELGSEVGQIPALAEAAAKFEAAFRTTKIPFLVAEIPAALSESLDGVAQIARIVLSMKEFSHPGTSSKIMTDINRALDSTLTVSRNVWKHSAEVERNFDPTLPPVLCHAGELNQVFLNLIVNAAHAIESSGKPLPGRITISTGRDGGHVVITVADSGTGVPEAIRERIFDPFFTTKEVGKGTGQGLAICRDVVMTKHGGSLDLGDNAGDGAVFVVRLPIDGAGKVGVEE
ncbi:PAS domain-containing sensor histidine kinase [Paramagnetospirillum magneticum]|uniref:histidine kinase n=1 Tax=Paramagnetospirillum magneticum (strain ATCC 700264 / AMB-1) TaxID=342108 RepID=Q2W317_PARM1|nr:PAS domain S-box protein [Paramagnetospirillum magneticum]BAE51758.1 Signal transduction histidine kinase [Paramagnetospirillum magneticum AMB-1]